jgi:AraC-like DNA-binding protein
MLDAEGATFTTLLNQARMQLATQYLANPRMRITDIAAILGYGSTGAFSRWYRQAFGQPPRTARTASSRPTIAAETQPADRPDAAAAAR